MVKPAGPRILVIDDEPDIGVTVARFLGQALGADVEVATSARAAMEALVEGPPVDLLLCDFRMPGMSGLEFLRRVRESHPDVIRVMMTAYADPALAERAHREADVARFLSKPIEPAALADVIRNLLSGRVNAS